MILRSTGFYKKTVTCVMARPHFLCIPSYYVLSGAMQTSPWSLTHKRTTTDFRVFQVVAK